ncbi:MAG TPA: methionyl-tRNA formyltransferase [Egibacteraceae bacterium]|nr:methionyl-tRNA formyltransferase [Egibacteraceae bacterium]
MRICFWGTPQVAVPALQAFLADPATEVAAVVTNPDRPRGRGYRLTPPPVKVVAAQAGVPVWQPQRPRDVLEELRAWAVDACAVVAYGALLPSDVLAAGGRGFVNLHFSLLPAWRGAAPVQHALLHGDGVTGVTCFVLDEGMDTGPTLISAATPIDGDDTAGGLSDRLARLGAPLLVDAVHGLDDGSLQALDQDAEQATYAPKLRVEDARLEWTRPAAALERAVRAFNPVPGAHTTLDGQRLKVHLARAVSGRGQPGTVIEAQDEGPVVACGEGALRLERVQPAGKASMSGPAFVNGYRPVGRRLGA